MFLFAGWNQCSHEHGQRCHMTKQKMHTNMCIEMHGTGTHPWAEWRVVPSRQMETDLDTTELHQHNDQSTQSRPKPEGSGRRALCYNKTIETTSRGSESGRWQSSVAFRVRTFAGREKQKRQNCIVILFIFVKIKIWITEQENRWVNRDKVTPPLLCTHTHRETWRTGTDSGERSFKLKSELKSTVDRFTCVCMWWSHGLQCWSTKAKTQREVNIHRYGLMSLFLKNELLY